MNQYMVKLCLVEKLLLLPIPLTLSTPPLCPFLLRSLPPGFCLHIQVQRALSVHPLTHLLIYPSTHRPIHSLGHPLPNQHLTHPPSTFSPIHTYIHAYIHSPTHPFIHSASFHPSTLLSIYPSTPPFLPSFSPSLLLFSLSLN